VEQLYHGKAKRLYSTDNPNELLMEFMDDATAFNGEKKASFDQKGYINKTLTCLLYPLLEKNGVPTHFIKDVNETSVIVKAVEIIPLEVVVRNVIAGSLAKRTGLDEGVELEQPIIEFYYKDDALGDPLFTTAHIHMMKLASDEDLAELRRQSNIVNHVLKSTLVEAGLRLVDFKLEFGRLKEDPTKIILADEISPDTCRLWDLNTDEKMDKDRFRRDLGDVMEAYSEVLKRVEKIVNT